MKSLEEQEDKKSLLVKDDPDTSQEFIRYLNLKNAKLLAVILVILFTIYHGYLNSFYGRNSCNRLLGEGHLLGHNEWQPFGCMIHQYKENDIQTCFKYIKFYNGKNKFYFIGDFRIRQVYNSFIKQFDATYIPQADEDIISNKNSTYNNKNLNVEVKYIWKPVIDELLYNLLESQVSYERPSFLVMGMAANYMMMNASSKESIEWFKSNLTNLVDMIDMIGYDSFSRNKAITVNSPRKLNVKKTTVSSDNLEKEKLSTSTDETNSSNNNNDESSIYWMLQDPIDELKLSLNKTLYESITNHQIDMFNRAAISILKDSTVNIWSSSRLISQGFNQDSPDGLRIGSSALKIDSQLLFNLYCNNRLNFNDASCCSRPEAASVSQQIIFTLFFVGFILTIFLYLYKRFCSSHSNKFKFNLSGSEISFTPASCKNGATSIGIYKILSTFTRLAFIILYFYFCDRANYFMKENQHFTLLTFLIPLIYVTIVGLFFHDNLQPPKLMNRRQTDEIKGFIQCVILIYKISSAGTSTPLYFLARLISSGYLFLSGYGHFMYYWNTSNYSITRLFQVLFRLNFLPVILCFSMNRMYQFYTFIPLVTFWYICSYIIMLIYPRISLKSAKDRPSQYFYLFIKLCLLLGCVITLNASDVIFEKFFMARVWKYLFVSSDDLINEWRSRWTLDSYSFILGMFFGLFLCVLKKMNIIDNIDEHQIELEESSTEIRDKIREKSLPRHVKLVFVVASLTGLVSYGIFAAFCKSRNECNIYVPYITIIPVISYIMLRNSVDFLSEKCSYMFGWIGKISLELYVCSYHIWLAADSNGILVLLPGYPVLNALIITFIFICIAHELSSITTLLSKYFVPNNWRTCLGNFFSFLILLLPIAIKYGYI